MAIIMLVYNLAVAMGPNPMIQGFNSVVASFVLQM